MPLPAPAPGLVIGYSYLWHDEHIYGAEEGRKDRPCAIVLAAIDDEGDTVVYVVPVTHSPPPQHTHAVAIPASVKRRLGLDDAPSWIVTSELNQFVWPGNDLRPIARDRSDTFAWGFLPTEIFEAVKRHRRQSSRRSAQVGASLTSASAFGARASMTPRGRWVRDTPRSADG